MPAPDPRPSPVPRRHRAAAHLRTAAVVSLLLLVLAPAGAAAGATTDDVPAHPWAPPAAGAVVRAFDPPAHRYAAGHRGADLGAAHGSEVVAPADGTVTFAGPVAGRGVVVVTHAEGLRSTLEPVDPTVRPGTRVSRGDPVGTLAPEPTHCAPGSCLHWGVRLGDVYVDPLALLEPPRIVLMPPAP